MVSGHADWQTWAGRSAGGMEIDDEHFAGEISSEGSGFLDLDIVAADTENLYQAVAIACPDDTAIHAIELKVISSGNIVFFTNFITSGIYDFPGVPIAAGEQVRLTVFNFAGAMLDFKGAVFKTVRRI